MAARDDAQLELNNAFVSGLDGVKVEPNVAQLMKVAFEMTIGPEIDDKGEDYWKDEPRAFALGNAERIGKVAAVLSDAAGRTSVSRRDYAAAANAVIERAQELCPVGGPGPQCRYWVPLAP